MAQVFLLTTPGSNFTYTSDLTWNNSSNTVEVIGAGAAGAHGASTTTGGGGGGGGAYNRISNFSFATPGTTTATCRVGAAGLHGGTFPQNGGDTWFNSAAFPTTGSAVGARGGSSPATNTTATGGAGGLAANGFPTTSPPGRDGGSAAAGASATAGGGGGGAGGPNGVGGAGSGTTGGTADGGTVAGGSPGNPGTSNSGTEFDATHGCGSGAGGSNASGGTGGNGGNYGGGGGGGSRSTGTGGDGATGIIVLTWTAVRPLPAFQQYDFTKPKQFLASVPFVVPVSIALLAPIPATNTLRAPVLGPPKKPPVFQVLPTAMGSPFTLFQPPVIVNEPRAPVLGRPFPPRISVPFLQSTPAPLLASLVQNPFIPYDFSTTHDVISSPPQATPYNINIYTNPIPFGPYDYSEGPTAIKFYKTFDQQPNYQNFYPNPVPFGPYDYNRQWPPLPSRPFDQQPNYPNFYPNPIPFGPFDWSKPVDVSSLPPQALPYNLALVTVTVAPPFFNPDFSKPYFPIVRVDQTQPTNVNLFTNPIPFGPFDWSKPFNVANIPPQPIPPNIALITFVVQAPFFNPDFSKPYFLKPLPGFVQAGYGNFYTAPFFPVDYNITHDVISAPPQATPYNINIFTNPIPFGPFDYQIEHDVISAPPQAVPYNINVFTNPIPFGPYDYSKGAQFLPRNPPQAFERNPLIFSEVPLTFFDWSRPSPPRLAPQLPAPPYAIAILAPVTVPIVPIDWSKPFFPQIRVDQTQPTNINLYTNPIPFGPYDWSARPGQYPPRAPDQIYPNYVLLVTPPPAPPFIPVDYSKPFYPQIRIDQTRPTNINLFLNPIPFGPFDYQISHAVRSSPPQPQPYNVNIFTNPIPFGPYDLSRGAQSVPRLPPQPGERNPLIFSEIPVIPRDFARPVAIRVTPQQAPQPYNVMLYAAPFVPVDFSRPRQVSFQPVPQPYNVALLTPAGPAPFLNIDWSKPFAIHAALAALPPNLTLILPPPVAVSTPRTPVLGPAYRIRVAGLQGIPNLTLILPPPPFLGIPSLCYSRDVAVVASTARDFSGVGAAAKDIATARTKAADVAAVLAEAKDFAAIAVKASDSPSGQDWSGAGYMSQYEIDTTIELQGIFTNALTGVYADPTSITLLILDPTGAQTTQTWPGGSIIRDSLGHFHFVMTPAISGNWTYKWRGTGAATATSPDTVFTINSSALIPG